MLLNPSRQLNLDFPKGMTRGMSFCGALVGGRRMTMMVERRHPPLYCYCESSFYIKEKKLKVWLACNPIFRQLKVRMNE